jgi:hypothetical protein
MTDVKAVAVAAGERYEEHAPKSVRDGEGGPTRRRGRKLPRGTNNGIYGYLRDVSKRGSGEGEGGDIRMTVGRGVEATGYIKHRSGVGR